VAGRDLKITPSTATATEGRSKGGSLTSMTPASLSPISHPTQESRRTDSASPSTSTDAHLPTWQVNPQCPSSRTQNEARYAVRAHAEHADELEWCECYFEFDVGGLAIYSPSSILPDQPVLLLVLALRLRLHLLLLVPLEDPAQQDKMPMPRLHAQRLAHLGSKDSLFIIEFIQESWGYRCA